MLKVSSRANLDMFDFAEPLALIKECRWMPSAFVHLEGLRVAWRECHCRRPYIILIGQGASVNRKAVGNLLREGSTGPLGCRRRRKMWAARTVTDRPRSETRRRFSHHGFPLLSRRVLIFLSVVIVDRLGMSSVRWMLRRVNAAPKRACPSKMIEGVFEAVIFVAAFVPVQIRRSTTAPFRQFRHLVRLNDHASVRKVDRQWLGFRYRRPAPDLISAADEARTKPTVIGGKTVIYGTASLPDALERGLRCFECGSPARRVFSEPPDEIIQTVVCAQKWRRFPRSA